ncbi:MAG: iron-sulfur cluster repair di-iron protein [Bacteroidota bacterium]
MEQLQNATIKSIVTSDYRAAAIFEKYSLDFCCKGGVTIEQACSDKNINAATVFAELERLSNAGQSDTPNFAEWPIDELIDYIVNVHHKYVRESTPIIYAHTQKVATVHGANHPEVIEIDRHFAIVAADMQNHMMKEEHMLFPYIKTLVNSNRNGGMIPSSPFGTVQNPIAMMEAEHKAAGDELYEVRSLSKSYVPPEDACTTYRVSYKELQQFEEDLHRHVHLENNILFPKAIALEKELMGK